MAVFIVLPPLILSGVSTFDFWFEVGGERYVFLFTCFGAIRVCILSYPTRMLYGSEQSSRSCYQTWLYVCPNATEETYG